MDPKGPSQPPLNAVYNTAGNPADQNPHEQRNAAIQANANSGDLVDARERGDIRVRSTHNEGATSTSLGYGAQDASRDKGESVRLNQSPSTLGSVSNHLRARSGSKRVLIST